MSGDSVASLALEQFRRLNERLDRSELALGNMKLRISAPEDHMRGLVTRMAGATSRLDRLERGVGPIVRRLDLVEAH